MPLFYRDKCRLCNAHLLPWLLLFALAFGISSLLLMGCDRPDVIVNPPPKVTTTTAKSVPPPVIPKVRPPRFTQNQTLAGKKLFESIIDSHTTLDKEFYKQPYMWGALTQQPQAAISIPLNDWQKITDQQRNSLAAYVASSVPEVKGAPLYYSRIPANAPTADRIKKYANKYMTQDSWIIFAGAISQDGLDIITDETVMTGL